MKFYQRAGICTGSFLARHITLSLAHGNTPFIVFVLPTDELL